MFASALLCLMATLVPQAPTEQSPKIDAWTKLTRLAGGEWVAGGEGAPNNFHRFMYGPGKRSLWLHTRNADKLAQWPQSESVYYWHPGSKTLRALSVGTGDALVEIGLEWQDERLDADLAYHISGRKLTYVSRWAFEGNKAYDWSLFTRTKTGLAEAANFRFTHQDELRPLPEIAPPSFKPSEKLAFLDDFTGDWDVIAGGADAPHGRLNFRWAAEGSAMLVEVKDLSAEAVSLTRGIMFWHPELKQVRLLEIGAQGEVQEGTVTATENGVSLDLQVFNADVSAHLTELWSKGPDGVFHGTKKRQVGNGPIEASQVMLRRPD
ncbi:MAG: hypothetical protein ACI8QC_000240 [Planctomycetota bacterium]|jgi:hypothetical protein